MKLVFPVLIVVAGLVGVVVAQTLPTPGKTPAPAPVTSADVGSAPSSWPLTPTEDMALRVLEGEARKIEEERKALDAKFQAVLVDVRDRIEARGFPKGAALGLVGHSEKSPGAWVVQTPAPPAKP